MVVTRMAAIRLCGEFERRPGRFFTLQNNHMGLDNYPVRCECGGHTYRRGIPDRHTHRSNEPCPFKNGNFPLGILASCCWLRGKIAARELEALGEETLSSRMYEDMTAEGALDFAKELRSCARRLARTYRDTTEKPNGAGYNGTLDVERKQVTWGSYSTFEEALAEIHRAARWYQRVGRLGYGVHAWS